MRKIVLSSLAVLASSLFALFISTGYAAEPENNSDSPANQKILAEFTITEGETEGESAIFLPIRLRGKEYLFFLDTGCSHTIFDASLKPELGEAKRVTKGGTAGSPITLELFDAPEAFIGPFNLQDYGEVSCTDFEMLSLILGKKVNVAIGMNLLKKHVVQIDFDKGKLLFLKPKAGKHPDWGEAVRINYHSLSQPYITGTVLKDTEVDFVIDTGAVCTGALHHIIFKEIISKNEIRTSEVLAQTASGTINPRVARIGSFTIGPFSYKNLIFDEGNFSRLGLTFLSRHLVTFDFPNNKVYLKKGEKFDKTNEIDMTGLHLLRISNQTVVHSVDKDSPADKAGIRTDDVILKVNGKNASEYEMWELGRLKQAGDKQKITMTIKHEDDVKEVSFRLKREI